jgi:MFS family permease
MSNPERADRPAPQPSNPQPKDAPPSREGGDGVLDLDPRATPTSMELGAAGQGLGFGTSADFDAEWDAHETALAAPAERTAQPVVSIAAEPLLRNVTFRNFWLSRLLSQIGQGALMYALLIIVVDRTDQSFYNSVFVVCAIIPSIVFGLPAGVVVDSLPRRPMLFGLNLLRFLFALSLVANDPSLPGIFATVLAIWTIHQFYAPTEAAVLASIVPRERYTSAQALSNLALTLAQGIGLVILAPLMLKTVGPTPLFAVCGMCFISAAFLTALLPKLDENVRGHQARQPMSMQAALLNGWRLARNDHVMYEVLIDDVLVGIGGSALLVITPLYLKGVLDTGAENTVFVFAPAALGLIVGLRLSPRLGRLIGERRVATIGLIVFSISVGALGFVEQIRDLLNNVLLIPTDAIANALHIPPLVFLVMLISIPAGFASSLVSVASRSVLLAHTPAAFRGQVIATTTLLQSIGALVPTLLAGVAADVIGVEQVAIAIAVLMAGGAIAAFTVFSPAPAPSQAQAH